MNLHFVVEGPAEKVIYTRWLQHVAPRFREVPRFADLTDDTFFIEHTTGQPRFFNVLEAALQRAAKEPKVDVVFGCVDAEEDAEEAKRAKVESILRRWTPRLQSVRPGFAAHAIVQNVCLETWLLGHRTMLKRNPQSPSLAAKIAFHDVSEVCPERMGKLPPYNTRAQFHLEYLREMLAERSPKLRYSKSNPGPVIEGNYLDALRARCLDGDLPSLARLLAIWDQLAASP